MRGKILLGFALLLGGALFYTFFFAEFALPSTPDINKTYTPGTTPAPQEVGSYDVLGRTVSRTDANALLATREGQQQLAAFSSTLLTIYFVFALCERKHKVKGLLFLARRRQNSFF